MAVDGPRVWIIPPDESHRTGNWRTAERYGRHLRASGYAVEVSSRPTHHPFDVVILLHAHRSAALAQELATKHSEVPRVVVLTGTDVYGDLDDPVASRNLDGSAAIVALQRDAVTRLPERYRHKAQVIFQSAEPYVGGRDDHDGFVVSVIANLRTVKDPLRAAEAVRSVPQASTLRVELIGDEIEAHVAQEARRLSEEEPRFCWVGSLPWEETRRRLAGSDVVVISSVVEGSSNVLVEAIVDGVPVLATRIPGLVGTLGEEYPGYFDVGDTGRLQELLERCETDCDYLQELREIGIGLRDLVTPEREQAELAGLLESLLP